MRLPKINSLYGRIFAIFWFTMLLVLIAVLALPHLDPRKTRDIPSDEYQRLSHLKQKIESTFKDEHELTRIVFRLENSSNNQRSEGHMRDKSSTPQFFITTRDGTILTTKTQADFKFKALQNFVTSIESIDKPQQKLYGRYMISGPLPITLAKQDLLLFVGIRWNAPPPPVLIATV